MAAPNCTGMTATDTQTIPRSHTLLSFAVQGQRKRRRLERSYTTIRTDARSPAACIQLKKD